ncbi:hypothetical protein SS322685_2861 [Shigella sonnei 3226-85]|nr:hypothetical protein SS322685_2861 [Shigella sonnei 3226-85]EJL16319.1 hypothetical protein SSMOSELEY_2702 [Shigella sonnei str. Moseley]
MRNAFHHGLDSWGGRYFAKNTETITVGQRLMQRVNKW